MSRSVSRNFVALWWCACVQASILVTPKRFLQAMTGRHVTVKLKWGMAYSGTRFGLMLCLRGWAGGVWGEITV